MIPGLTFRKAAVVHIANDGLEAWFRKAPSVCHMNSNSR